MVVIKVSVSNDLKEKLDAFKKIVDTVLEEKTKENDYFTIVLSEGLKALLKTVIPQDNETLWLTIEKMSNENPKFVGNFVVDRIRLGGEVNKKDIKEKIQPSYA